jgi:glycosyltransferase involved in cell wall biosynthesis
MMPDPFRYALIPTNGRPCLKECIEAVRNQVDKIILVEGGPGAAMILDSDYTVIREPELNISKWWNLGLKLIESRVQQARLPRWDVVILNDDAIIPDNWVQAVAGSMREAGAAAACSGGTRLPYRVLHTEPGPVGLMTRMQGFAFVLAGEKGIRADEKLHWYFSDDHVDWMARKLGGMLMIPGMGVEHLYPNSQMTAEMQAQVAEDAAHFYGYWGMRPW